MLGDVGDAEDVAQEAFLRLARADATQIDDIRGWLTVVAGRLCLDQVRSARVRHERPDDGAAVDDMRSTDPDPADRVTLDDEVRGAMFEVLRRLSPGERVAFVLHDVFQIPFEEIAETVGRPVGTCRQLARRARAKFSGESSRLADVVDAEHQLVTERFITACANGDLEALTAVLDPTVWGVGTILGELAPATAGQPRPGRGRPQPSSLSGTRRNACQWAGRGTCPARLRRPAAVRGHRAHGARQLDSEDRGHRRPIGGSPTVVIGLPSLAYSVVVEPSSPAASARCRSCTPVRWRSRHRRTPPRRC